MSKQIARMPRPTLSPAAQAVGLALAVMAGMAAMKPAFAGPGWVEQTLTNGSLARLQTFVANSPSGVRQAAVPEGATLGTVQDTGKALRKFVDPLPLIGAANARALAGDAASVKYIPQAVASKWIRPDHTVSGDDYYEIAVVEYKEKFHSDIANPTTLRGYVQIDHEASNGRPALAGSLQYALIYPDGTPIMINGSDANGKLTGAKVAALAVDKPHYLGPVITGVQGTPTRVKFLNLLPVGRAEITSGAGTPDAVVTARNGDLFLPVDKSILGAGYGPDGITVYTQNRANLHLHGGDNPWISDGSPHQWITPLDESDAGNPKSLAAQYAADLATYDPAMLPGFLRGASNANVPDMFDPGQGASTYYYPNGQTARMLWLHDQTVGQTRLNHYAGMAAPYLLTDAAEAALVGDGTLPPAERTIPLVIQDQTFVPKDIALQDGRWNTSAWGAEGDLWFSHVYESIQDPAQLNSWNVVGRWYYGPLFWPIFPAMYALPSGAYGDETITPESYHDTPTVNGVAYPTLDVDPTTYRFRVLNGSVDRHLSFNLFVAKTSATLADGTVVTSPLGDTEVDMVQASAPPPAEACLPGQLRPTPIAGTAKFCVPESWPVDSRAGGVPDPKGVGPTMYQVANEGGWLPKVATIEPSPILYNIDKGRITIFNVEGPALVLTPAERADLVIDFSAYAGKTLIVYNDAGAPEPGADPRNAYYTGAGDNSSSGGAEDPKPGFGPNIRTVMQIKVRATAAGPVAPLNLAKLQTKVAAAYVATQERPLVAQPAYDGFDPAWAAISPTQSYASIFTATLKEPTFKYVPGTPSVAFNSVQVVNPGTGYVTAPAVTFTPTDGQGSGATAQATMKIDKLTVTSKGSGYTTAPTVAIVALQGGGSGAQADARLAPDTITVLNGGTGYATVPTVSFPAPPAGAIKPEAHAIVSGGVVTQVVVDVPGSGYAAVPTPIFGYVAGASGLKVAMTAGIDRVTLVSPYPTSPDAVGGGGYTDFNQVAITLTGGGGTGAAVKATGRVFDVSITNNGSGYTAPPTVALAPPPALPGNIAASAQVDRANGGAAQGSLLAQSKAVQELHDVTYGRYNNTLGIELPFTTAFNQTTIPLGYLDTATEVVTGDETQLWKFTHNGLFNQAVHFRLFNVQVVNRVGWDGFIAPPAANELGWKETVRINPLEDTIVALRPKKPVLPGFGLPLSVRPMDPTQPLGSPYGFTQIDPVTGNPMPVVNDTVDFGWEYTIQNAINSRAENDFIRPMIFHANEALPAAPSGTSAAGALGAGVVVGWVDNSSTEYKFEILRADVLLDDITLGAFEVIGSALANGNSFVDSSVIGLETNASGGISLAYKVRAVGAAGFADSATVITPMTPGIPAAPTGLVATAQTDTTVKLAWADNATNEAGYLVERSLDGGLTWLPLTPTTPVSGSSTLVYSNLAQNSLTTSDATLSSNTTVSYRVSAVNVDGQSAYAEATVTTLGAPALASLTATPDSPTQITLNWQPAAVVGNQTISSYQIVRTGGAGPTVNLVALGNATSIVDAGLVQNTAYTYTVRAMNGSGAAPVYGTAATARATTLYALVTLNTLSAMANSATQVQLAWTGGVPATSYLIERCTFSAANFACTAPTSQWVPSITLPAPASGYLDNSVNANSGYSYRVTASNGPNLSNTLLRSVLTPGGALVNPPINLAAVPSFTLARITLTWTDTATNETAFIVERSLDGVNFSQVGVAAPRTGSTGRTRDFIDSSVSPGVTYTYRVMAQNVTGTVTSNSLPSNTVTVDYFLLAPTGLAARIARTNRITLNWTDASTAETAFAIWRSDGGAAAMQVGSVTRNTAQGAATGGAPVTFNDNFAFALGTTYDYYVTAVNGPAASAPSNIANVPFLAPAAPATLTAAVTQNAGSANRDNVLLTWDAVPGATSYTLQRMDPGSNNWNTQANNINALTFNDTRVRKNATVDYTYRLRANGAAGNSGWTQIFVTVN